MPEINNPKTARKKQNLSVVYLNILKDGLLNKNPSFVQLLGMCPLLAITTSVSNGLGMGLAVTFVLIFSNIFISLLRDFIPSKIRIASYVVIIAGFVSIIDMLLKAYLIEISKSLGLFIPLIVVNCVILARAESFASKNGIIRSFFDGLGMGLGVTCALTIISFIRELLGAGTVFGINILGENFSPALLIISPPGGFLVLGCVIALVQFITSKLKKKAEADE